MYGTFTESALEMWDFVRCQRANGTFYGTAGTCRKGVPTEVKREMGRFLGGGKEGQVYDIGRGRVLKVSSNSTVNKEAQEIAAKAGLAPRLLSSGETRGKKYQVFNKVDTDDIEGIGQPGRSSKLLEELSPESLRREKQAYLAAINLNSLGVAHGDLHGGNLKWDKVNDRPVIMDFDNATVSTRSARKETKELLTSVGIRLEESGFYDEADEMYRISSRGGKDLFQRAAEALEEHFPEG